MINEYMERVIKAAIQQEQEAAANFFYKIWQSHSYLILLPKVIVDNEVINLGHVVVKDKKILGINPILVSELEKRLTMESG